MSALRLPHPGLLRRLAALGHDQTLRHTALIFVNNIVGAAGGMLFWFLATRRLDPATVGVVSAGTALVILLASVGQLGLGMGLIRYGAALGPARARRLAGIVGLVAAGSWLAGAAFVWSIPRAAPALLPALAGPYDGAIIVATCVAWGLTQQSDNHLVARRLTGLLAVKGLLTALARPLLLLAVADPTPALLIGMAGLSGLVGIAATAPFVPRHQPGPALPPVSDRELLAFSLWSYLGGLAGTLPSLVLPAIVVSVVEPGAAAAYYMAWTLFSALLYAPAALGWVRFAEGAAGVAGGARSAGPLFALLPLLFAPPALAALAILGPGYLAGGWPVILVLAAGFWPYCRAQIQIAALRVRGAQWRLTAATTLCHLIIIAASPPLLRLLGAPGAALAWSAGQALYVVALWWAQRGPGGAR